MSNKIVFQIMDKRRLKTSSQVFIDTFEYSLLSGIVTTSIVTGLATAFRISKNTSLKIIRRILFAR